MTGTNKNDVLYGGKGNDTLYGGLGADTLVGGEGDDTYYVDNVDDVINESSGVPAPPDASWITSSDLRDLYTRTYPRIMGNQWNVTAEGYFMTSEVESNVNGVKTVNWEATNAAQEKIEDFVAKYLDYITLNRVGVFDGTNGYGDLFLDNYDSVMNPEKGLLKINNELKAEANELGRKFYVMPYLNLTDVWNYESVNVNPDWNFWHSQQNYNGQDFGTWDFANDNDLFLKKNGEVLHYYGGGNDTRPIFDPNNWKWQQYYIQHIKGILDQGFDGIFSDNWWRSKYMGDLSKLTGEEFAKVQDGWSNIGNLIQDALGADKVFIGNSPVYPKYNSRDVVMLEDRIDDVLGTADKSIASYFRYSAQARDANQVCQDSYWNESLGPFETFRLPIVLMTDNILGIGAASNVGTPLDAIMTPIKTIDEIGYALGDKQLISGTATGVKDILQDGYEVERGVYVRYYTYGVTYLNDTEAKQTVTLPTGKWLRSDGKSFSGGDSITLDSCRGWVFRKADGIPLAQNQGTDTVVSSISYTLGSNLENLTLSGTANISATGNELNNVLTGNTGNNLMAGLAGNDTYLFKQGFGADVINEVAGQDSVKFDYDIGIDNVTFSKINNALKISVNGTNNYVTVNDWFVDSRYQTENVLLGESTITNIQINTALQNSGGTSVKASSLFV